MNQVELWFSMLNGDVISMPDKWEYPWYAARDLAFHTIALSLVDFDFAKEQLLPLCASTMFEEDLLTRHPKLMELIALFRKRHPEVLAHVAPTVEGFIGHAGRRLLSPLTRTKLESVLSYLLDENEFLSPYGIRALSRYHLDNPFVFHTGGQEYRVQYLPAESNIGMFGGNSNWRDLILFYEYFHGDIGAGIGANHQTGWTGLISVLLDLFGRLTAEAALETPKEKLEARLTREQVAGA